MDNTIKIDTKPKTIKFDQWMDLKKESFGGPKSAIDYKPNGENGQTKGWQRKIERNKDHENGAFNQNQDGWWKAVAASTGDKPQLSKKGEQNEKEVDGKADTTIEDFLKNKEKESN